MQIPTSRGIGVIALATITFFGPMFLIVRYTLPLPPDQLDLLGLWYLVGSVAVLTALIGPAFPRNR